MSTGYELKLVESPSEWDAYHSIRRDVLWNGPGRPGGYNPEHPDDRRPGRYPLLLIHDGEPVAVVRVDLEPPVAWLRRVAVRTDVQRQGNGRQLLELAERFAAARGCTHLCSNVDANAVGFYRKLAFNERTVDRAGASIPMEKYL